MADEQAAGDSPEHKNAEAFDPVAGILSAHEAVAECLSLARQIMDLADNTGDEVAISGAIRTLLHWAYKYVVAKRGQLEDRAAHTFLLESGIEGNNLGELADYEPPTKFGTFRRNLSEARAALGESKHSPRNRRPTGRSIVRADEVERQTGDD
jgi:hypothetical protein